MDLHQLEYAARIVFDLCRKNPDICPHDYEWHYTQKIDGDKYNHHYVCRICGNEIDVINERDNHYMNAL